MPLIDYADPAAVDESTRDLLERSRNDRDEIPAFPRMLANNPTIFEATMGQYGEVLFGGDLELPLKQLVIVTVSQANDCAYCAATHGAELVEALGLPATHLEAVTAGDYSELSDRQRAVVEFAHQAATDPKRVTTDHLEALRAVGFDDSDVVELVVVTAQATFANTIADVMNIRPQDQSADLDEYYPADAPADD